MDDAFLMGVLNRPAHLDKQVQALPGPQPPLVAKFDQGLSFHQFHHEVGSSLIGRTGGVDARNPGMIHHGQRLALRLKA